MALSGNSGAGKPKTTSGGSMPMMTQMPKRTMPETKRPGGSMGNEGSKMGNKKY